MRAAAQAAGTPPPCRPAAPRVLPRAGERGSAGAPSSAAHGLRRGQPREVAAEGQRSGCFCRSVCAPSEESAGTGLGSHARSQRQLREVASQERRSSKPIAPSARSPNPRAAPGEPGRAPHRARAPSAARGSKPAFLPAAILIPCWSCSEIYTSCRLTGTLDTPPRAITDILKFHKLSQSQPEYSSY